MKNNVIISVYITNSNYGKYLEKSIQSVLKQTYKFIEIIIIDDASTDNSKEILEKYKKNKNIAIIYNKKKKGLVRTANIAIKASNGDFFLRLDADDYLHSNAIKTMYRKIKKHPDVALVFCDFYNFNDGSKKFSRYSYKTKKNFDIQDNPAHGACSLISKKIFKKIGCYNNEWDRQDGYYIWLAFLLNNYRIIHCKKPLFFYRKHNNNLSSDFVKIIKTRLEILNFFSKIKPSYKKLLLNNKKKTITELNGINK